MDDGPGDLFVVALSLLGIWMAGRVAVHIIAHFWKGLLVLGVIIGLLWVVLALAQAWADKNQEWKRLEREWDGHIEWERERIARRREALESAHRVADAEFDRIENGETD